MNSQLIKDAESVGATIGAIVQKHLYAADEHRGSIIISPDQLQALYNLWVSCERGACAHEAEMWDSEPLSGKSIAQIILARKSHE